MNKENKMNFETLKKQIVTRRKNYKNGKLAQWPEIAIDILETRPTLSPKQMKLILNALGPFNIGDYFMPMEDGSYTNGWDPNAKPEPDKTSLYVPIFFDIANAMQTVPENIFHNKLKTGPRKAIFMLYGSFHIEREDLEFIQQFVPYNIMDYWQTTEPEPYNRGWQRMALKPKYIFELPEEYRNMFIFTLAMDLSYVKNQKLPPKKYTNIYGDDFRVAWNYINKNREYLLRQWENQFKL
jgi:hypothetical protein